MHIVLLGPPGSGKGSLASLCKQRLRVPHISTGDIFRQEISRRTRLGRQVRRYVTSGRLVPDSLVVEVMGARLSDRRFGRGFIVDGFPRTAGQALGFDRIMRRKYQSLDGAVYLDAPEAVLVRRLSGRRVCSRCGANYHVRSMRPRRRGICDRCAGSLIIRKDDEPQTIRKRLAVDRKAAKPLIGYYKRKNLLHRVSGVGGVEQVFARVTALCRRQGWM